MVLILECLFVLNLEVFHLTKATNTLTACFSTAVQTLINPDDE